MTVAHLLPIVMVAEAPPHKNLGPLGVLDCDSGLRLARLDPHHQQDLGRGITVRSASREAEREQVASTLGLFKRRNLLEVNPGRGSGGGDAWPKDLAADAWRALAPRLAGRRVCLVGRAAEAAGFKGLPPLRWLWLGGEGEPAEVCRLPHPSGTCRWYNKAPNKAAVGEWLREVRREREDVDSAWVAIGGGWAYHLAQGMWGQLCTTTGDFGDGRWTKRRQVLWHATGGPGEAAGASEVTAIRDRLLEAATGVRRGGGGWTLSILDHCLLVADLCTDPDAKLLALAHDLHETPLVGDASSPLKRIMRREWRPVERVAQGAVERLLGLDPTPEGRECVRLADRLALLVEARQAGVDLGNPTAEFGLVAAEHARLLADALAARHATPDRWLRAWEHAAPRR